MTVGGYEMTKRAKLAEQTAMADFAIIVAAAAAGKRCPQGPRGTGLLRENSVGWLIRNGMIRSEIYRHNFRVVTILTGPHANKSTARPDDPKLKPWLTIDAQGRRDKRGRPVPAVTRRIFAPEQLSKDLEPVPYARTERPQPSKPRTLTREEISKL